MSIPKPNYPVSKHPSRPRIEPSKKPTIGPTPQIKNWCFSFRFWQQIEFFGLDGKNTNWFISLMDRLREISKESLSAFWGDSRKQEVCRYHKVDWGQYRIPITRDELKWLPSDYLNNEADFPFYQFSISKGLGRIAGFWDENQIFNIVLIDPYHNLQPSKDYDYKVTSTQELPSEHEILTAKLNLLKNCQPNCSPSGCSTQNELKFIEYYNQPFGILYVQAEYFNQANELVKSGKAKSIEEVLEMGVLQMS